MATIKKGILGGFSGKVGTVIGANWKGIDYIKSLPKASSKAASQKQIDQRLRFATVMAFLKPIHQLISLGYQAVGGSKTPLNASVSYHIKNALDGISPNYSMDVSKVVFSQGDLLGASLAQVSPGAPGSLDFTWQDNSNGGMAQQDDEVILLVYNEAKKQFVVLEYAATREDEQMNLILPTSFIGDELACWISFANAERKRLATSLFIGKITLI